MFKQKALYKLMAMVLSIIMAISPLSMTAFADTIVTSWDDVQAALDSAIEGEVVDLSGLSTPANDKIYVFEVGDGKTITLKGNGTQIENVAFVFGAGNNITIEDLNIKSPYIYITDQEPEPEGYRSRSTLHFEGMGNVLTLSGDNIITNGGGSNSLGYGAAVGITETASLIITGEGSLNATGKNNSAGIGSGFRRDAGSITINGGTITATGDGGGAGIGSGYSNADQTDLRKDINITINGGTIIATSDSGAGIGSGSNKTNGGDITINGGKINATSNTGAGIGNGSGNADGSTGCDITITGGIIEAKSETGAGVGGGNSCDGGNISITGGTILATSTTSGAGIGGGNNGNGGSVIITGGSVNANANGGSGADAIGKGSSAADSGTLTDDNGNDVYLNKMTIVGKGNTLITAAYYGEIEYGTNVMETDADGNLYFYLPESEFFEEVIVVIDDTEYITDYDRKDNHDNNQEMGISIKSADVDYEKNHEYTGFEIEPEVTVTLDGEPFSDENYTVEYEDNIEAGTATIIITGIVENGYAGTIKKTFTIKKRVEITGLEVEGKVYDGAPYKPAGEVNLDTDEADKNGLVWKWESTDGKGYNSATAPTNAGDYKLTISMSGDDDTYFGSEEFTFSIAKRPVTVKADDKRVANSGTMPVLTYSVVGQLSGETALVGKPIIRTTATGTRRTGTYPITVDLVNVSYTANYTAASPAYENGTLTVSAQSGDIGVDPTNPSVGPSADPWENPFIDVDRDDWFYGDVEYVAKNGLFYGTSETTFSPDMPMTRGMLVTVLWRMIGEPEPSTLNSFEDVESGMYYEKAIAWAAEKDVVLGYGNGKFGPNDSMTREQMVTVMHRYAGLPAPSQKNLQFVDAGKISFWAYDAIAWATGTGIVNGKPGGLFDPQGGATRAEVAAVFHRFLEQ